VEIDKFLRFVERGYKPNEIAMETAEYVLLFHYDQSLAPRIFVGPPGIGKSVSITDGFALASSVIANLYRGNVEEELSKLKDHVDKLLDEMNIADLKASYIISKAKENIGRASSFCEKDELCLEVRDFVTSIGELYKFLKDEIVDYVPRAAVNAVLARVGRYGPKNAMHRIENPMHSLIVEFDHSIERLDVFRLSFVMHKLNISSHEPADLLGVLGFERKGGRVISTHYPPNWALSLKESSLGMLFLDEFTNQMIPYLETTVLELINDNKIGELRIGKAIVGAGNDASSSKLVRAIPGVITTGRSVFIPARPPKVIEWIRYMDRKYGTRWFIAPSLFLLLFSKYGIAEEMREMGVLSELTKLTETLIGDEPFLADPDRIKQLSSFLPSTTKPQSFPSPRSWERVLRELYLQQRYIYVKGDPEKIDESRKKRIHEITYNYLGNESLARILSMLLFNESLSIPLSIIIKSELGYSTPQIRSKALEEGLKFFTKATDTKRISKIVKSVLTRGDNEDRRNELFEVLTILALSTNIIIHVIRYVASRYSPASKKYASSEVMKDVVLMAYGMLLILKGRSEEIENKKSKVDFWAHAVISSQLTVLRELLVTENFDFLLGDQISPKKDSKVSQGNILDKLITFIVTYSGVDDKRIREINELVKKLL